MRILLVNMYYSPNMIGGAEHSIMLLAEGLVKAGQEVAVLTLDGLKKGLTEEIINGVLVFRAYSKSISRRRILRDKTHPLDMIMNGVNSIVNPCMNNYVKRVIHSYKPDVVHTNNLVSMSYWIWRYCYKQKIPLIHTLRDYWLIDPTTNISGSNPIVSKVFSFFMKRKSNRYVTIVTAPSNATIKIFNDRGYFHNSERECVVNCIDFSYEVLKRWIMMKSKIKDRRVSFLYAGYLSENKGIKLLIQELKLTNADILVTFCGDGPLLQELKEYGKNDERVIVKGRVTKHEMDSEYEKADILLVPSLWEEPFGRIVIEAAQYAVPTIGSNKGGIPETIEALEYGEIVSVNEHGAWARCIDKYANRKNIQRIIATPPANIDRYRVEKQVDNFIDIYHRAISLVKE